MFDVVKIVFDFDLGFVGIARIALRYLRPAGQAGFDDVAVLVKRDAFFELFHEHFLFGARADKAHVAFEDVEKLRQFVQPCFADKAADARDAVVADLGELGTVLLGIGAHAAEFVNLKFAAALSDTVLDKQHAAGAFQADGDDGEQHQR